MEERLRYLFNQYLNNKCTRKEFEEFLSLIHEAKDNKPLKALIRKIYNDAGLEDTSLTYVDESGNLVLPGRPEMRGETSFLQRKRRKTFAAFSILLTVAITSVYLLVGKRNAPPHSSAVTAPLLTKKQTERSEYKYMLLPDSTQVWLNAASKLEFPETFTNKSREVYLSGEAYFDVKHAEEIPFIIHTGKVATTVLGTAFNIKAYPGRKNVVISVSRGKVKVSYDNKEVATLIKGQQVKVNSSENKIPEKKTAVTDAGSWQHGNLVYDDDSFEDITADLEQIYNVTILINNPAVAAMDISTSFNREIGVEEALHILCKLTDSRLVSKNGMYSIN